MHISGLQNCILLWYFTSAIWGKLFYFFNYFGHSSSLFTTLLLQFQCTILSFLCDLSTSPFYFHLQLIVHNVIQYLIISPMFFLLCMYNSYSIQHYLFLPMMSAYCTSLYAIFTAQPLPINLNIYIIVSFI